MSIPLRMCSFLVRSVPVESYRSTAAMNGQREETPKNVLIFLILGCFMKLQGLGGTLRQLNVCYIWLK